ncbi:MAG: efflux RND transporter permease subunit [Fimbriimonadaceae bacterium]|nr:efflux RND transporter permease subunit [Fimbriimonadaceae bacterium]
MEHHGGLAARLVSYFADSKLTPLVIVAAVLLGFAAVVAIPREEEPQIVVPMVDVLVRLPGATPREMERRVAAPLEQFLWEVPGVEYLYSTSSPEQVLCVVRFKVGEDVEDSLVKLQAKLQANYDKIPPGVQGPLIKPRSIDDVPILALTFWGQGWDSFRLRQLAADLEDELKQTPDVSETTLIGGEPRQINVELDLAALSARGLAPGEVAQLLQAANNRQIAGDLTTDGRNLVLQAGRLLVSAGDVNSVVLGTTGGAPVYLRDVARVTDGPGELTNQVEFQAGPAFGQGHGADHGAAAGHGPTAGASHPAVTLAVAKRRGTNAIVVVEQVLAKVEHLRAAGTIPPEVQITVTRDYGETANEKANELLYHMGIAVISVTLLIGFVLGWRESGVVALAIPVTLALTMFLFHFIGFTLNRITLFALIFSIGILVDDPIVDVENIVRHFRMPRNRGRNPLAVTIEAVNEVRSPLILATFAVMAAILPMAFVRGMMGPYMRPIPVGASAAMFFSMAVAFVVTPWAAYRILQGVQHGGGHGHGEADDWSTRLYRKFAWRLVTQSKFRNAFLGSITLMLLAAVALVPLKLVRVKMLPFDNKSEFQVIVDLPEGTSLARTTAATRELAATLRQIPEVKDLELYVGTSGPYNFNGLVRHYFLRRGEHLADIQVNLSGKHDRQRQSHAIAREARDKLLPVARRWGATLQVAEVPPGPPVLQTLVAEVYGPDYDQLIGVGRQVLEVFRQTPGVVDADIYTEDPQTRLDWRLDGEKAGLHNITAADVAQTLRIASDGLPVGLAHDAEAPEDVAIKVRLNPEQRESVAALGDLKLRSPDGHLVPLDEVTYTDRRRVEPSRYHKNLQPVIYITADMAGSEESPVYAILKLSKAVARLAMPDGTQLQQYNAHQPFSTHQWSLKWDGEWHITIEVFRDLGIAFAAVLVLIYALVVGWFASFKTPLVIMTAIPFSLVGILPAHWLGGVFFTATSMIGFIAGAGIVVRNSIILVDFIDLRLSQGMPLEEAVVDAGAVRFRPMLLTAMAVIIGTAVILLDPIFQGLAVALMAGEVASLLLSRMAVPILYYLSIRREHPRAGGIPVAEPDWDELSRRFSHD